MKTTYYRLLFPIALLFIAASCKKSEDAVDADPSKVAIVRTAPTAAQVFHKGDTVKMNAIITAPFELHGYVLTISNAATGAVVFDEDEHVHDDHFNLTETWVDTLSNPAMLKVALTVEVDHEGHSSSDSVLIQSQP